MRNKNIEDWVTQQGRPDYWRSYQEDKSYEDEAPQSSSYQLEEDSESVREDEVYHPSHYNKGKVECIEAIEAMLTPEEYLGYLRGNSLKYHWRFRYKKKPRPDLLKALWYDERVLDFYIENATLLEKAGGDGTKSGEDC
jgi:hypothetical protein